MKISGFSFGHNLIESGYPIVESIWSILDWVDELVVVDMESTDGTKKLLEKLGAKVIDGKWGNKAGETLADAHRLNNSCTGDIILHFEADEVWDENLIWEVSNLIEQGHQNLAVYRIQLEQNFQRCRWYPELVHRVFPRGSIIKEGHTTNKHNDAKIVPMEIGMVWDCTNCFRDNYLVGIKNKAELWNEQPTYRYTPIHFTHPIETKNWMDILQGDHWEWTETPFKIPKILKPLVGKTKYEVDI